jgi:intracellular multiplication protein IcmB
MSLIEKVIHSISKVLVNPNVSDYISAEMPHSDTVVDMEDSTQMTLIRINGMRIYPGEAEVTAARKNMADLLKSTVSKLGHKIEFVFERDKDYTGREVDDILQGMRNTASRHGMNIDDILEERRTVALRSNVFEATYLAVYTHPTVLGVNCKEAFEEKARRNKELFQEYKAAGAANIFVHLDAIDHHHSTHVKSVSKSLEFSELDFDVLHVEDASSVMGFQLERAVRTKHWRARLPAGFYKADRKRTTYTQRPYESDDAKDMTGAAPYSMSDVLPANDHSDSAPDGTRLPQGIYRVGDQYYTTLTVLFWPDTPDTFESLMQLLGKDTPYRIAWHIDGNKGLMLSINQMFRSFITQWADRRHPMAKAANEQMIEDENNQKAYVRLQGQISTWGSSVKIVQGYITQIQSTFSKWNSAEVMVYTPAPIEAYISGIAGASISSPAPEHYAPVNDCSSMLPLSRPASIWPRGTVPMSTPDGKMFPVSVVSQQMENNTVIVIAKQRSGKSVLLNTFDFSLVFTDGLTRLPRMVTIDSAPSSKGKVEMLRQRLPDHMKDMCIYYKMSNKQGGPKVNVFDLILGCDFPLAEHREFLNSFISTMAVSIASMQSRDSLPELVNATVKETYEMTADISDVSGNKAKLYHPGVEPDVDEELQRLLPAKELEYIKLINGKTRYTWFEARNVLYKHKNERLAYRAQKHAVPTMSEFLRTLSVSHEIHQQFPKDLIEYVKTNIQASMAGLPLINGVSTLDLNNAKVLALDLKDVTAGTGAMGQREATLMYLLGIFIGTQLFFIDKDSRGSFNPLFLEYADRLIDELKEDIKRLSIDEYWKTGGLPGINQVVEMIERVGPKFNISMLLSSQNFGDFSDVIVEGAGGYILMGKPNDSTIDTIKAKVGMTESSIRLLKSNKFGTRKGEVFFIFDTSKGRYYQHLYLNIGTKELWANSTTNVDTTFRAYVTQELGEIVGYQALAEEYPGGSVQDAVDILNKERAERVASSEYDTKQDSIAVELAKELVGRYQEKIRRGQITKQ